MCFFLVSPVEYVVCGTGLPGCRPEELNSACHSPHTLWTTGVPSHSTPRFSADDHCDVTALYHSEEELFKHHRCS